MLVLAIGIAGCDSKSGDEAVDDSAAARAGEILHACEYVTADDVSRVLGIPVERSQNPSSTAPCAFASTSSTSFVTVRIARGEGVKNTFDGVAQRWPGSTEEPVPVDGVGDEAVWIDDRRTLLALVRETRVDVQGDDTFTKAAAIELAQTIVGRL